MKVDDPIAMTITTKPKLTFDDYLQYNDGTDNRYELVHGELKRMNPPTFQHVLIAKFLERMFDFEIERIGLPWVALREVGVRTEDNSSRLPDVCVVPLEQVEALMYNAAVLQISVPLVVEIISPSSSTEDYKEKLAEYQALGVPEYWVVNPESKKDKRITVYQLANKTYQKQEFRGNQRITSVTSPKIALTAEQVLRAKPG